LYDPQAKSLESIFVSLTVPSISPTDNKFCNTDGTQQEPDNSTLPSQELSQNDDPSTSGGVGKLPGPPAETGVSVLPEERISVDQASRDSVASIDVIKTSPITTTTNNNPVHSDPSEQHTGYIPDALQRDTSLAVLPEERRLASLPSHDDETGGRLGTSSGVGALPGSANESGVALLPDERQKMQELASGGSTDASIRRLPGTSHAPPSLVQTTGREYALARDEEKAFGRNVQKDLDAPQMDDAGKSTSAAGAGSVGLSLNTPEAPKKSGFMHKVKGEMKIISGKMSHNESLIEEGRKLMGKN
jgi:hypothetical protein